MPEEGNAKEEDGTTQRPGTLQDAGEQCASRQDSTTLYDTNQHLSLE